MNETLGEPEKTVSLFEEVDKKDPEAAENYWIVAKDAVIAAKRFDLARKYIGNLTREFVQLKAMFDLNTSLYDDPRFGGDEFKSYNENKLVEESLKLIEVAIALGNKVAAAEIQTKASAVVADPRLSAAISSGEDQEAQQDGPRQPATAPDSKSEGNEKPKPKPKSEERSQ